MKTVIKEILLANGVMINFNDGSFIVSESAESFLLYKILITLERMEKALTEPKLFFTQK